MRAFEIAKGKYMSQIGNGRYFHDGIRCMISFHFINQPLRVQIFVFHYPVKLCEKQRTEEHIYTCSPNLSDTYVLLLSHFSLDFGQQKIDSPSVSKELGHLVTPNHSTAEYKII